MRDDLQNFGYEVGMGATGQPTIVDRLRHVNLYLYGDKKTGICRKILPK